MSVAIGIDVGGTAIKLGVVGAGGRILARRALPFDRKLAFPALADRIGEAVREMVREAAAGATAIGVATPGYADPETGVLVDGAANVPALAGQSLAHALAERTGLPVRVVNDGRAATVGELRFGAGRGLSRFALATIGTGIGGGVVIGGEVLAGPRGEPPEIGALALAPETGSVGLARGAFGPHSFETLAAAGGFIAAYAARGGDGAITVEALFHRAAGGEPAAIAAVDATCRHIAQAFGIMINLLNLEACLIGGGVSAAGPMLLAAVRAHLPTYAWPLLLANAEIRLAQTGNDAGWLGAAALAAEEAEQVRDRRAAVG
jgi:glucokinase